MKYLNKDEFELAFRHCQDDVSGHSYDQWDIDMMWADYQLNPDEYDWLLPFVVEKP